MKYKSVPRKEKFYCSGGPFHSRPILLTRGTESTLPFSIGGERGYYVQTNEIYNQWQPDHCRYKPVHLAKWNPL